MTRRFSQADLEAYLDEALSVEDAAHLESQLRTDAELCQQLRRVVGRRDAGVHSLGEIWRRHRVSCPDREQLANYVLDVLDEDETDYVRFHLEQIGCRLCQANLDDLRQKHQAASQDTQQRRRRYLQSSAGYLEP